MGLNKRLISSEAEAAFTNTGNFAPVLYTGDGTSSRGITGVGFQPDLVIIKNRGYTDQWSWADSVRGGSKWIASDSSQAESTNANAAANSFDSDGFTVSGNYDINRSGYNFFAWCFKGGGTAVSNTNGSITSTVSANQAAGFSIVSFTGPATNVTSTVGHGLSQAPELVITKILDSAVGWYTSIGGITGNDNDYLILNSTAAVANNPSYVFGPHSSTTFTTSQAFSGNNPSIAYCFHSVDGYQKIGSYTGNGTSNSITGVGFQPRFVLIKRTDSANGWNVFDSVRGAGLVLFPHTSGAELDNTANFISFDSDGFSLASSGGDTNASGGTYIYLAIK